MFTTPIPTRTPLAACIQRRLPVGCRTRQRGRKTASWPPLGPLRASPARAQPAEAQQRSEQFRTLQAHGTRALPQEPLPPTTDSPGARRPSWRQSAQAPSQQVARARLRRQRARARPGESLTRPPQRADPASAHAHDITRQRIVSSPARGAQRTTASACTAVVTVECNTHALGLAQQTLRISSCTHPSVHFAHSSRPWPSWSHAPSFRTRTNQLFFL